MLHQPRHGPAKLRAAVVRDNILHRLTELQGPGLRGLLLREIVVVPDHRQPDVSVEVVNGPAGADEQVAFHPERPQRLADSHMEVRIEARVHGDNHCWRAAVGKHADENEICIVDPVKRRVSGGVETGLGEHSYAAFSGFKVGVERVVDVFGRVNVCDRRFTGVWVCGDLDLISESVPVSTLS